MSKVIPITFRNFKWLNEPSKWRLENDILEVTSDLEKDFWGETYYNFTFNSGHAFGVELEDDFTIVVCLEADFTTLYDQAGLMLYVDEKHWLKTGVEHHDGQLTIGAVLTNEKSDWSTGTYTGVGTPTKCWMKLSKVRDSVIVKYSTDKKNWILLRLCPFPASKKYFVGPLVCTPKRDGLKVKFSDLEISDPVEDPLHE